MRLSSFCARQPLERDLAEDLVEQHLLATEVLTEDLVETIEVTFVLDQRGARQVVEAVDTETGNARFKRAEQAQVLGDRDRDVDLAQLVEELS